MSTSRLEIYNDALVICGERVLASLTEDRKPRRLLDHVWDNDGVDACLERGQWKFAMKTVKLDIDTDVTNDFGYRNAFSKPDDWILTSALCSDEFFTAPLLRYEDENNYWYAEIDEIYVKYVSNSTDYGQNLGLWPATFADFVAGHFAKKIILSLTQDAAVRQEVDAEYKERMMLAKNNDAMAGPQKFPAPGDWVNSRYRGRTNNDRGNRGSLIG